MRVRPILLVILAVIGVGSVAKLLIQRYSLLTAKDIPVMFDSNQEKVTERETVLNSEPSDHQHPSEQLSTPQVKSRQTKTINKPTSARIDKMIKTEANSKFLELAQPAVNYAESMEKFKLAVEDAEASVKRLESINY